MSRFVAFLRGINVGPTTRVPMSVLRELFAAAGCTEIVTLLNSGNVVFTANQPPDAAALEHRVKAETGVSTRIVVLDTARLRRIADGMPFVGDESKLVVAFADAAPASGTTRPTAEDLEPEQLQVGPDAIYQHCPNGISNSALKPSFWKQFAAETTARNYRTVQKLLALAEG